jgi:hypothetical protein
MVQVSKHSNEKVSAEREASQLHLYRLYTLLLRTAIQIVGCTSYPLNAASSHRLDPFFKLIYCGQKLILTWSKFYKIIHDCKILHGRPSCAWPQLDKTGYLCINIGLLCESFIRVSALNKIEDEQSNPQSTFTVLRTLWRSGL